MTSVATPIALFLLDLKAPLPLPSSEDFYRHRNERMIGGREECTLKLYVQCILPVLRTRPTDPADEHSLCHWQRGGLCSDAGGLLLGCNIYR